MFVKEKSVSDEVTGFIGRGITLSGKLNFQGTVRIDGDFEGEIDADGVLTIGEEANVRAKIRVGSITVMGEVHGSIDAKEKVVIQVPGKVLGDIKTSRLVIEDGAVFEGNCVMSGLKKDQNENVKQLKVKEREVVNAGESV